MTSASAPLGDGMFTSASALAASRSASTAGIIADVGGRQPDPLPGGEPERGYAVAVVPQGADPGPRIAELEELARTANVEVVGRMVQQRARPDARTYVGKGKL